MYRIELWRPAFRIFGAVYLWDRFIVGETPDVNDADELVNQGRAALRKAPADSCVVLYKDGVEMARRSDPLPLVGRFCRIDESSGRALFVLPRDVCLERDCGLRGPHEHLVTIEQMTIEEICAMDDVSLAVAMWDSIRQGYRYPDDKAVV